MAASAAPGPDFLFWAPSTNPINSLSKTYDFGALAAWAAPGPDFLFWAPSDNLIKSILSGCPNSFCKWSPKGVAVRGSATSLLLAAPAPKRVSKFPQINLVTLNKFSNLIADCTTSGHLSSGFGPPAEEKNSNPINLVT